MGNKPGTNTGHGHVWERPDGVKARCGGTILCGVCQSDQAALNNQEMNSPKVMTQSKEQVITTFAGIDVKKLTDKDIKNLADYIEEQCRFAKNEELNDLYDNMEAPADYDICDVVHEHVIATRLNELLENRN